jgi:hypothetical protein
MKDRQEPDWDALADWTLRTEEAVRASENTPIGKFSLARARRAVQTPAQKSLRIESAAMPTLKEPERITLPEGLTILQQNGLSLEEAKARLRQAFVQKAFPQAPLFAFEYDEAYIDWTTGFVKIPRKKERFCPTFSRFDFQRYFFEDQLAPPSRQTEISEAVSVEDILGGRPPFDELGIGAVPQKLKRDAAPIDKAPEEEQNKEASLEKARSELVTLKPNFMGCSIDLKELGRRARSWWKNRR